MTPPHRLQLFRKIGVSLIGLLTFSSNTNAANDAGQSIRDGVTYFKAGKFQDSVNSFDTSIALNKASEPFLWQRGLALYFNGQYNQCASQFMKDVDVNPRDTEEAIWNYVCRAETSDVKKSDIIKLAGVDSRPIMRVAYGVFDGTSSWQQLRDIGTTNAGVSGFFYSRLYLSLYFHTLHDSANALKYINEAVGSSYSRNVQNEDRDLMVPVGRFFQHKLLETTASGRSDSL